MQYVSQVEKARAGGKKPDLLPKRTDMTPEEVTELISAPTEAVIAQTREELKDYADRIEAVGLGATLDEINAAIDADTADGNGEAGTYGLFGTKTKKEKSGKGGK